MSFIAKGAKTLKNAATNLLSPSQPAASSSSPQQPQTPPQTPPQTQQQASPSSSSSSPLNAQALQQLQQHQQNLHNFNSNNIVDKADFDYFTMGQKIEYIKQFLNYFLKEICENVKVLNIDNGYNHLDIQLLDNGKPELQIFQIIQTSNLDLNFEIHLPIKSNEATTPIISKHKHEKVLNGLQYGDIVTMVETYLGHYIKLHPQVDKIDVLFNIDRLYYNNTNPQINTLNNPKKGVIVGNPIFFQIMGVCNLIPANIQLSQQTNISGVTPVPYVNIPQSASNVQQSQFNLNVGPSASVGPSGQQQQPQLNQPRQAPFPIAQSVLSNFFATNPAIINKISAGINMDIKELKEFIRNDPKLYKMFVEAIKASAGQEISPDMMNSIYNNISTLKELQDLQQANLNSEMGVKFRKFVAIPKEKQFKTSKNLFNT